MSQNVYVLHLTEWRNYWGDEEQSIIGVFKSIEVAKDFAITHIKEHDMCGSDIQVVNYLDVIRVRAYLTDEDGSRSMEFDIFPFVLKD